MELLQNMTLELIGRPIPYHASHSGYHQLVRGLGFPLKWYSGGETPILSPSTYQYLNEWYRVDQALQEVFLSTALLRRKVDLVHFLYGDGDFRMAARHGPNQAKYVATFHLPNHVVQRIGIDDAVISSLDGVIVVSDTQREYFEERHARAVFVVPHGINTSFYSPGPTKLREPFRILTVGHWMRDFDLYFRLITLSHLSGLPLKFRLISRPLPWPRSLIPQNCVLLSGLTDEQLRDEYRRAACICLPLNDSTANNALLEAIACGVPYVVSDVGSVREYVDESAGILVNRTCDEHVWLESLMTLSTLSAQHLDQCRAARELAVRFSWQRVAEATRSVYARVTS